MSLDDAVDMLLAQYTGEGFEDYYPEDEEFDEEYEEYFPEYKLYEHGYITVGENNDIRAHVFKVSLNRGSYWEDQDIYIIQSKKALVLLYKIDLTRRSLDEPEAPIPTAEEYVDDYEIIDAEFEKVLQSIKLCGY